jgi:hypothetical protein
MMILMILPKAGTIATLVTLPISFLKDSGKNQEVRFKKQEIEIYYKQKQPPQIGAAALLCNYAMQGLE